MRGLVAVLMILAAIGVAGCGSKPVSHPRQSGGSSPQNGGGLVNPGNRWELSYKDVSAVTALNGRSALAVVAEVVLIIQKHEAEANKEQVVEALDSRIEILCQEQCEIKEKK